MLLLTKDFYTIIIYIREWSSIFFIYAAAKFPSIVQ